MGRLIIVPGMARENSSFRLRVRYRPADVRRRLVLPPPFIHNLAQQRLSPVQARYFTSATSSGRTQCTRLKVSGDPKRLSRGGGRSSGILGVASGCRRRPSRSSSAWPMVAGAAGVK
jgi:hypothetical protein